MSDVPWDSRSPGVMVLPSGRHVRGRGLKSPLPPGPPPQLGIYLLARPPEPPPGRWKCRWLQWRDFWLPADPAAVAEVLAEAWHRASDERVEVACGGGRGRTGTALACLAVLDGVPAAQAVAYVRRAYDRHAVETPWQRRYVERFSPRAGRAV